MPRPVLPAIVLCVGLAAPAGAAELDSFVPVTDAMVEQPAPGDWLSWRRTQNGWAYSPLTQVNKRTVAGLKQVWTHALGDGPQESTPLIYNGVMYVPNRGDYIQAYDAATGALLWEYKRQFPEGFNGATNRNLAIWGTTLIDAGGDNQIYAVDARTGTLVWETRVHETNVRARATSGPIIAGGKVITGRQCQPDATFEGCVVTAHDAATGKELWRTHTIPQPGEPGNDSWGDVPMEQRWHVGTWMVPSYDPALKRIYVGTSVTIPAAKFQLGGVDKQHLYHNSTLSLDLETGKIVWYYQHLIDHWDLDHPFERLLVDTAVTPDARQVPWINPRLRPGERRKVVTGIPGKTGLVYTLDRETGEFLWARPTIYQNVIANIDGATGIVNVDPARIYTQKDQTIIVCPGMNGGKNWPAGAYSPRTNAMYMPMQNQCMTARTQADGRDSSLVYGLEQKQMLTPGNPNQGTIWAISAQTGDVLWKREQRAGVMSMVATAGGLIFGGDVGGNFRAYDEKTGDVVWETNVGAAISGYPVSYAVDGKQYVAVTTGSSGVYNNGRRFAPEFVPERTDPAVFVFALP